jgi:hypothetical protein
LKEKSAFASSDDLLWLRRGFFCGQTMHSFFVTRHGAFFSVRVECTLPLLLVTLCHINPSFHMLVAICRAVVSLPQRFDLKSLENHRLLSTYRHSYASGGAGGSSLLEVLAATIVAYCATWLLPIPCYVPALQCPGNCTDRFEVGHMAWR